MDKLLQRIKTSDLDKFTIAEIKMLIERKLDEQAKFRGQIARDLRRIGDYAFQDPSAYRRLKEKYRRAKANRKKFAILDIMQAQWCKSDTE